VTRRREKPRTGEIPAFEWVAAAIGALLLAASAAVLVRQGLRDAAPPDLAARVDRVERAAGGWRVELLLENRGDETAEQVTFTAELAGRPVAEIAIDRLPGRSSRRGGFFLAEEPAAGALSARATGFVAP
jgi:uncharacterized protein (TIGR02588 family)